jgi:hypothetical protein
MLSRATAGGGSELAMSSISIMSAVAALTFAGTECAHFNGFTTGTIQETPSQKMVYGALRLKAQ